MENPITAAIAKLQEELRGLGQNKAFADMDRATYNAEHQRITKEIGKLRDQLPSNFYSPEPTGHDPLKALKNRVAKAIEPYRWNVHQKDYNALHIALNFATCSNQVESLYHHWQEKLRLKNIAKLPDLKPAPKPETQKKAA